MKKPNTLAFAGLHLLLTLSLPFVLVFLFGCKRAKEEKADLGPEVSADAIDAALSKAITGATLDGLHVGEYLNYVVLRRLENADSVMLMGGTNVAIIDAQDSANQTQTKYTLQINKTYRKDDGSFQNVATEDALVVKKPGAAAIPMSLIAPPQKPLRLSAKSLTAWAASTVSAKAGRTSFHRLRESDDVIDPPDKVRSKPDCGGLVGCRIPVHYIKFDLVQWFSDSEYQKIALQFGFSLRTPFLPFGEGFDQFSGLMVIDCRSTYVQLETRNVFVEDCQQLEDFQK
jgi:hypothetical protein